MKSEDADRDRVHQEQSQNPSSIKPGLDDKEANAGAEILIRKCMRDQLRESKSENNDELPPKNREAGFMDTSQDESGISN